MQEQTQPNTEDQTTPATEPKTARSLSVSAKISAVVAFCLMALIGTNGFGVYKMQLINYEIEAIADRDIPLTKIIQQVTVHQLE
jgi:methyl-accepting chemotaxis protein